MVLRAYSDPPKYDQSQLKNQTPLPHAAFLEFQLPNVLVWLKHSLFSALRPWPATRQRQFSHLENGVSLTHVSTAGEMAKITCMENLSPCPALGKTYTNVSCNSLAKPVLSRSTQCPYIHNVYSVTPWVFKSTKCHFLPDTDIPSYSTYIVITRQCDVFLSLRPSPFLFKIRTCSLD